MNIEDKALDIILDHTASSEWEDVCELTWNTDEVQELLIKALKQGQSLPIDSVMPCFEFSGKATKYNQGVAVDTDGIALSNDILPHKAYTLEEGVEYIVKLYKA